MTTPAPQDACCHDLGVCHVRTLGPGERPPDPRHRGRGDPYSGGNTFGQPFPGAIATAQAWATYDGCTDAAAPLDVDTAAPTLDLEATIDGDDARVSVIGGCPDGIGVELWTIDDAFHVPSLSSDFVPDLLDFLSAHPKP